MRRLAAAALAAAGLAGAGLSGCAAAGAEGPEVGTVVLDVHHSRFSPAHVEVSAGQTVRFVVRNADPIPHELIVGDMAVQDVHERGTEAHHADRPGEVSVAPGATAETTYTFRTPGRLYFGCHLPGHWAYGMQGVISVR
ncbi:MAG: plastocyanin/azurin family copper-binding protein [Acidimicrobiia bacterium]